MIPHPSHYKTAKEAAEALRKLLTIEAFRLDLDPSGVILQSPDESECGRWAVVWEEGPFEWAEALAGGNSIYATELGDYESEPEIDINGNGHWHAEPHRTFELCFYDF